MWPSSLAGSPSRNQGQQSLLGMGPAFRYYLAICRWIVLFAKEQMNLFLVIVGEGTVCVSQTGHYHDTDHYTAPCHCLITAHSSNYDQSLTRSPGNALTYNFKLYYIAHGWCIISPNINEQKLI